MEKLKKRKKALANIIFFQLAFESVNHANKKMLTYKE